MHYHLSLPLYCLVLAVTLGGCRPAPPVEVESDKPDVLSALPAPPILSPRGYQLILDYEVGGGRAYYDKFLSRPTVPPVASGLTIGVGYDTRFYSAAVIKSDWSRLPAPQPARISEGSGKAQAEARVVLEKVKDILIPWTAAEGVFNDVTISQYYTLAKSAYPGLEALHPDAQAVIVSLVFNRGSGMRGETRREMRNLRPLVLAADYPGMAQEIRSMKRLWPNTRGLLRRREAEAAMLESIASK